MMMDIDPSGRSDNYTRSYYMNGGDIIVSSKDKPEQKLHFETDKSIYGYQIEEISKNLIQGINKVNFPIMSLDETLLNMKIIDDWLNYCEK